MVIVIVALPCVVNAILKEGIWEKIEVGKLDGLEVYLQYRSKASLSDEAWIQLEFKNTGDKLIQIEHAHYRIKRVSFTPDGKTKLSSGGLASGVTSDLFAYAWETTPKSNISLSPQASYIVKEQPSRRSSSLLGLPPREGLRVKAKIYMRLALKNTKRIDLAPEGVPFEFDWQFPDEMGFLNMQRRLKSLLKKPQTRVDQCHGYILAALLKIPEVADSLSLEELFEAIDTRRGGFDGRGYLVKYLLSRNSDHEKIIEFYLTHLKAMDIRVCDDLFFHSRFWDTEFIEPLVVIHESKKSSPPFRALQVLSEHRSDWKEDRVIAHRLSTVLLDRYGMLLKQAPQNLIETNRLVTWAMFAHYLSLTLDIDALPFLIPFLDYETKIYEPRVPSSPGQYPAPYRLCDVALNAVLTILEGDFMKAYQRMGVPIYIPVKIRSNSGNDNQILRRLTAKEMSHWRDSMIIILKDRLSTLKL